MWNRLYEGDFIETIFDAVRQSVLVICWALLIKDFYPAGLLVRVSYTEALGPSLSVRFHLARMILGVSKWPSLCTYLACAYPLSVNQLHSMRLRSNFGHKLNISSISLSEQDLDFCLLRRMHSTQMIWATKRFSPNRVFRTSGWFLFKQYLNLNKPFQV